MINYHLSTDQAKVLKSAIRNFLRYGGKLTPELYTRPLAKALVNCEIADQQQINVRTLTDGQPVSEYSKQRLRRLYAKRERLYRRTENTMNYQLVTRGQFEQFLAATGYDYPQELLLRQNWTHPDTPIVWVSQVDALAYCEWVKGSLPPSEYYDMPANLIWSGLWEWCSESGVLRGGSFLIISDLARCSCRDSYLPASRDSNIGFRCSREE